MGKGVQAWTGNTTEHTKYGAVKGFEDLSCRWVWKTIPFAKPPVGDLRWKAPRDPVLQLSETPARWTLPAVKLGTHEPV